MIRYVAPSPEAAQALMDGTSTLLVVEGVWDQDDSVGLYGTPYVEPPADYVRATTSGERIGIYVDAMSATGTPTHNVLDGLVLVGSVLAVEVLPIVAAPARPSHAAIILLQPPHSGGAIWRPGDERQLIVTAEALAYHDPASLPGRFGVTVTDARRADT